MHRITFVCQVPFRHGSPLFPSSMFPFERSESYNPWLICYSISGRSFNTGVCVLIACQIVCIVNCRKVGEAADTVFCYFPLPCGSLWGYCYLFQLCYWCSAFPLPEGLGFGMYQLLVHPTRLLGYAPISSRFGPLSWQSCSWVTFYTSRLLHQQGYHWAGIHGDWCISWTG